MPVANLFMFYQLLRKISIPQVLNTRILLINTGKINVKSVRLMLQLFDRNH